MAHFSQSDHLAIQTALAGGKGCVLFLASGPLLLTSLGAHNPSLIIGQEPNGAQVTVFADRIDGWSIVDADPLVELQQPLEPRESDYMVQWQAAYIALRAACDQSGDPDVSAAMANLEAIEHLADQQS